MVEGGAGRFPGVVAVCTLTTRGLAERLRGRPGVAAAGPLMTPNLGIEELVRDLAGRPAVLALLVCGVDSPLFLPGQSLVALFQSGVRGDDRRIVGARGFRPYLRGVTPDEVEAVRARVELVDLRGEMDAAVLAARIDGTVTARAGSGAPGPTSPDPERARPRFRRLQAGGPRRPVATAGAGFFVVSVDELRRELVLRHYYDDYRAGYEARGRRAERVLRSVLSAGVVTDPDHAGYLGGELVKAETALRLGLEYVQDVPLRSPRAPRDRPPGGAMMRPTLHDFVTCLADVLDVDEGALAPESPLEEQVMLESARVLELAVFLEQEFSVDLDDVDLRRVTPADLWRSVDGGV